MTSAHEMVNRDKLMQRVYPYYPTTHQNKTVFFLTRARNSPILFAFLETTTPRQRCEIFVGEQNLDMVLTFHVNEIE